MFLNKLLKNFKTQQKVNKEKYSTQNLLKTNNLKSLQMISKRATKMYKDKEKSAKGSVDAKKVIHY